MRCERLGVSREFVEKDAGQLRVAAQISGALCLERSICCVRGVVAPPDEPGEERRGGLSCRATRVLAVQLNSTDNSIQLVRNSHCAVSAKEARETPRLPVLR